MKTIDQILTAAAVLVTACVAALSAYLFFANVGQKWTYCVSLGVMVVAWFVRRYGYDRRNVTMSLVLAGLMLSVALGAKALEHLGWAGGSDIAARTNGVIVGSTLVLLSNGIPKRMSSATALAMLRTVGRAFVIGGLGYAVAWLVLPLHYADTVATVIVLASLIVAAASFIGWCASGNRSVS